MDLTLITAMGTSFLTTLATKGADAPGNTLNLAWQYTFHGMDSYFKQGLIKKESAQKFQESISNNLKEIPNENIVEPRKSILLNALDSAKNSLDEDSIRDMFAKLIASSMDITKQPHLHPGFIEIIKQLSPTDANLLQSLKLKHALPIAHYSTKTLDDGQVGLSDNFTYPLLIDYIQTTNSINNLMRFGLIEIPSFAVLTDENKYSSFDNKELKEHVLLINGKLGQKAQIDADKNRSTLENYDIFNDIDVNKGMIRLTAFGESFLNICVS